MRIFVLGAAGFIGRHILADLLAAGHAVTGAVRRPDEAKRIFPSADFVACDLSRDTDSSAWRPRLDGVNVVVNVAGVLRGPDMEAVHVAAPRALYRACAEVGTRRAILISAISARANVETKYAQSKLRGEAALMGSGLDWTVLRPSLVYAKGSYGGTSLLRGMSALPFLVPLPGDGDYDFTPIHANDLARAVRLLCESERFVGSVLEPVGPETLTLRDLLGQYRSWLGLPPARFASLPLPVMRLIAKLGDWLELGPISTSGLKQLLVGNSGDPDAFARTIGFVPRRLGNALIAEPADVQDRWHARLYFLAPLLKGALVLMWIASGLLGLLFGGSTSAAAVAALGLPFSWSTPLLVGSSLLDFLVAGVLLVDRRGGGATIAQLLVVGAYTAVLSVALPELWLDPLGALVKNLPILAAILVHGALSQQ